MIKRFAPYVFSAFTVASMLAAWLAFAPRQAGGLASYTIIIGKSMEPKFHMGDLVIVHEEPVYQVGDAVVYRNLELGNFVFHRIISQDGSRYQLQGDNNSWADTYRPTSEEIFGKLWLYIPRGGLAIKKIRSPYGMAFLAALLGGMLATSLVWDKTKGNRSMKTRSLEAWFYSLKQKISVSLAPGNRENTPPSILQTATVWETLFFSLGLIFFASLILGVLSFSRPASRLAQKDLTYEHLGVFSYLASAPQTVYDQNAIKSGDPIFPNLTCSVDVGLQYTLIAPEASNISGTYQLTAVIREDVSGWQRNVPLQEKTAFTGTPLSTTAKLDLCKIEALTQAMEKETGFHPGVYTLSVTPHLQLEGKLAGDSFSDSFDGGLTFVYDRVHFYLAQNEEEKNPLSITETGVLNQQHIEANTLSLLGKPVSVPALRQIALLGLVLSIAFLALLGWKLQTLSRADQEQFFRLKYGALIVDVQAITSLQTANRIDVLSMDALAKLAERFNAALLHTPETGNVHTYYVQAGEVLYRFAQPVNTIASTIAANELGTSLEEA